jgi:hypothetical protein
VVFGFPVFGFTLYSKPFQGNLPSKTNKDKSMSSFCPVQKMSLKKQLTLQEKKALKTFNSRNLREEWQKIQNKRLNSIIQYEHNYINQVHLAEIHHHLKMRVNPNRLLFTVGIRNPDFGWSILTRTGYPNIDHPKTGPICPVLGWSQN